MINQIDIQLPETSVNLTNSFSEQPTIKPTQKDIVKREVDETGFVRFEHTLPVPLENGVTTVIFKNEKDKFQTEDPTIAVIDKDVRSIVNYASENLGLNVLEDLKSTDPIWSEQKRDIVEGLIATSIYDKEGKRKTRDDAEGPALLLSWLTSRESSPELAKESIDELISRKDILFAEEDKNTLEDNNLMLGEIPIDKIYTTHATGFLPHITGTDARILPRIDTDGVPRTTIHTYINGMVEEHSTGGLLKNSWESQKYMIGMKFKDSVNQNGLPANFFKADTFWSLEPGAGMAIPEGSFIILPVDENEQAESFKKVGLEVVTYDPSTSTLRDATKKYFLDHEIPFIENISPKDVDRDDEVFAKALNVRATTHYNYRRYSDPDQYLVNCEDVIKNGEKLNDDGQGNLSWEDAERIAMLGPQAVKDQHRPKKSALSRAYDNVRSKVLEMYFEEKMPKESLVAAYIAKLL